MAATGSSSSGPPGQIADSNSEHYDFLVPVPEPGASPVAGLVSGDHMAVVRDYDRFDTLATAKAAVLEK